MLYYTMGKMTKKQLEDQLRALQLENQQLRGPQEDTEEEYEDEPTPPPRRRKVKPKSKRDQRNAEKQRMKDEMKQQREEELLIRKEQTQKQLRQQFLLKEVMEEIEEEEQAEIAQYEREVLRNELRESGLYKTHVKQQVRQQEEEDDDLTEDEEELQPKIRLNKNENLRQIKEKYNPNTPQNSAKKATPKYNIF
jgi:hypothetical protein